MQARRKIELEIIKNRMKLHSRISLVAQLYTRGLKMSLQSEQRGENCFPLKIAWISVRFHKLPQIFWMSSNHSSKRFHPRILSELLVIVKLPWLPSQNWQGFKLCSKTLKTTNYYGHLSFKIQLKLFCVQQTSFRFYGNFQLTRLRLHVKSTIQRHLWINKSLMDNVWMNWQLSSSDEKLNGPARCFIFLCIAWIPEHFWHSSGNFEKTYILSVYPSMLYEMFCQHALMKFSKNNIMRYPLEFALTERISLSWKLDYPLLKPRVTRLQFIRNYLALILHIKLL